MQTFKIAQRNIWRQRRRTVLTVLTMLGGFTLASISIAWSDGTYNFIIDMFTRNQLGHIQIHHPDYLARPALYKTIDNYSDVIGQLQHLDDVEAITPRLYSTGLAAVGEKSAGARIIGINPERENETTNFENKICSGRGFSPTPAHEALLGRGLARVLKAAVGDTVVIVSQAADGSIANDLYPIIGLVASGNEISDRSAMYLHLADAQELFSLEDRVHEIVIVARGLHAVGPLTAAIKKLPVIDGLAIEPWQEFAKSFYQAMMADKQGGWISLSIIIFVVAIGVLNTVLMNVLERRREYGLLRAVGTPPGQIIRLVLSESAVMAVIGIIIGAAISLVINYLLSLSGIDMPQAFTYGGIEFKTMYTEINARSFYIPAITVLFTSVLVSILPALKAAHVPPAQAMRIH
jgi:ABC-type lipoprotein release transport system permease subunit